MQFDVNVDNDFMNSIANAIPSGKFTSCRALAISIIIFLAISSIALPMLSHMAQVYGEQQISLAGTTFPPPIFYKLRNIPSYGITIPFTSSGFSNFDPADVSIPAGMTLIWFNDGNSLHSVTTNNTSMELNNLSHSVTSPLSPEVIDSGPILPNGGSFIHIFSKPGTYNYYDKFNPSMHGTISVGTSVEQGKNMNMMIGGSKSSFNPSESRRIVLSFVPKTMSIPPTIALTYQVTISNTLRPWIIFSHKYDDSDGIFDLELIPTHKSKDNSTEFTTWGPDFRSQEAFRTTGTYHIKGPLLVENSEYDIRIAVIARDGTILSKPIADTFVLLPVK